MFFSPVIFTAIFNAFLPSKSFCVSFFLSLQFKEAKVEPINIPPTPSSPSENEELSGEPVPEGTPETTNLSVVLHSSPEPGKSWVCPHDDSGPSLMMYGI